MSAIRDFPSMSGFGWYAAENLQEEMNLKRSGKWIRKRTCRAVLALAAAMVLVLAVPGDSGKESYDMVQYTAWWGTLYPKYCFSQKPQESGEEKAQSVSETNGEEENPVKWKTAFWMKRFFDYLS